MVAQMHRVETAARIAMGGEGFSTDQVVPTLPVVQLLTRVAFLGIIVSASAVAISYLL